MGKHHKGGREGGSRDSEPKKSGGGQSRAEQLQQLLSSPRGSDKDRKLWEKELGQLRDQTRGKAAAAVAEQAPSSAQKPGKGTPDKAPAQPAASKAEAPAPAAPESGGGFFGKARAAVQSAVNAISGRGKEEPKTPDAVSAQVVASAAAIVAEPQAVPTTIPTKAPTQVQTPAPTAAPQSKSPGPEKGAEPKQGIQPAVTQPSAQSKAPVAAPADVRPSSGGNGKMPGEVIDRRASVAQGQQPIAPKAATPVAPTKSTTPPAPMPTRPSAPVAAPSHVQAAAASQPTFASSKGPERGASPKGGISGDTRPHSREGR